MKKTLNMLIKEVNANYNIYSVIVRRFVDSVISDLKGELKIYSETRRERARRRLEGLYTYYSKEITKMLYKLYDRNNTMVSKLLQNALLYLKELYASFAKTFNVVLLLSIETNTRVIIHTKSPYMPLEIGLAWHPLFNLPYIPSTSIKGAFRSYIEEKKTEICNYSLEDLFGSLNKEGLLVFTDALPVSCKTKLIEPEVITPHYIESEDLIDESSSKPRPLVFPVIASGVELEFIVAARVEDERAMCLIKELPVELEKALRHNGIGAKVNLGYGMVSLTVRSKSLFEGCKP
ncbi:MAG: type III-B CRISPR module RAMP protein Cmr6 [Desulfurococcales archaeon ex4484_217_2]|nr:MAG: type III-B CRISPR module RAMP protein Cmr6 [Desulfurococcales archaeon ex4484_217_2]